MTGISDLPTCHRCGVQPAFQWTRLATAAEAAAQRADVFRLQGRELDDDEIVARYGPMRVAVGGCADHAFGAESDDPHDGAGQRALLHSDDCGGHDACDCEEATSDGALD